MRCGLFRRCTGVADVGKPPVWVPGRGLRCSDVRAGIRACGVSATYRIRLAVTTSRRASSTLARAGVDDVARLSGPAGRALARRPLGRWHARRRSQDARRSPRRGAVQAATRKRAHLPGGAWLTAIDLGGDRKNQEFSLPKASFREPRRFEIGPVEGGTRVIVADCAPLATKERGCCDGRRRPTSVLLRCGAAALNGKSGYARVQLRATPAAGGPAGTAPVLLLTSPPSGCSISRSRIRKTMSGNRFGGAKYDHSCSASSQEGLRPH